MQSKYLEVLLRRYPQLMPCKLHIQSACELLCLCLRQKGKILLAGNGGSASDTDHIAGELLKSFAGPKRLPKRFASSLSADAMQNLQHALPAIPLPNLTGIISAFCNDCHPEWYFAQLVWGLGQAQDALWCLSTSGNSKNILRAMEIARAKKMTVLGLTGESGGQMKNLCDVCICVPETETFKIQELHLPVYHCLCLMLESYFFPTENAPVQF
ncbi:MAG: SIS domain-containing protein [Puniceicoccales bacterium]|jgi:D-sedoheptulose 7-phosphate isomerase|nr:SIS domain-containing protein [Puniceicoccales bacterium]